ncbi:MAG: 3-deoxy-D-manno-octulosonic acid transferase [Bacteroidales bacterium]|nr:3-deoxy-D-manno-octulosonic acid transferase [Bacteroidales bacterium]
MKILYDLGIVVYTAGIYIFSVFNDKARLWVEGRKGIFRRLKEAGSGDQKVAWFHVASLGEFEQGRPVMERFRRNYPEYKILLTFFSPSGYEVRKNFGGADHVFYLPADTPGNAKKFVRLVRPSLAVFVKYEFWLNYLEALSTGKIPVISISSVFRESQYYFRWYGAFALKRLKKISGFFVQDEASLSILQKAGITRAVVSGDTRFDRVAELKNVDRRFPELESVISGRDVFLAGSSWEPDEEIILPLMKEYTDMVFVFAPHEVDEKRISSLVSVLTSCGVIRHSQLKDTPPGHYRVIVIDSIGILSHLYKYAKIAYIGGGFGRGIHNILEAATFGKPLIFGPEYGKFREACDLLESGGATAVRSSADLKNAVASLMDDSEAYQQAAGACSNYTRQRQGATEIILRELKGIMSSISSRTRG